MSRFHRRQPALTYGAAPVFDRFDFRTWPGMCFNDGGGTPDPAPTGAPSPNPGTPPAADDRAIAALRETNTKLNAEAQALRSRLGRLVNEFPDLPKDASDQQLLDYFKGLAAKKTAESDGAGDGDDPPSDDPTKPKRPATTVARTEYEKLKTDSARAIAKRDSEYQERIKKVESERDEAVVRLKSHLVRSAVLEHCAKLENVDGPSALIYLNSTENALPWKLEPGEKPGELFVVDRKDGAPYFDPDLGRPATLREALAGLPKVAPSTAKSTIAGGGGGGANSTNGSAPHVRQQPQKIDPMKADPRTLIQMGVQELERIHGR